MMVGIVVRMRSSCCRRRACSYATGGRWPRLGSRRRASSASRRDDRPRHRAWRCVRSRSPWARGATDAPLAIAVIGGFLLPGPPSPARPRALPAARSTRSLAGSSRKPRQIAREVAGGFPERLAALTKSEHRLLDEPVRQLRADQARRRSSGTNPRKQSSCHAKARALPEIKAVVGESQVHQRRRVEHPAYAGARISIAPRSTEQAAHASMVYPKVTLTMSRRRPHRAAKRQ